MRGGPFSLGQAVSMWRHARRVLCAPRQGGFTIIEVLIVIGVSAALFLAAAIMISGRQSQAAFDQSIRQVQSQIQQAMNEVAVGYYPESGTFQCSGGAGGPLLDAGVSEQGTNSGCIFLGKALQFGIPGTSPQAYAIYTIAGLQKGGAGGDDSSTLAEARPMIVAPSTPTHDDADYPDNTTTEYLQNGLRAVRMWYKVGATETDIGAVAFVSSLSQFSLTGSGQVDVVAIGGTTFGADKSTTIELMNSDNGNRLAAGTVNPTDGVYICFESGGTKQYGIVKIGGDNRELAVSLAIKTKNPADTTCTYP